MALGFTDAGWFYDCMILWLQKEPVKLSLAALAIAFIKISMTSLTPVLAAAQSYGDNHVNFTQYGAFSKLCGSSATCVVAGVLLLVQGKKYFTMRASLHAYAVIAIAAAIAVTAENQLSLVGEECSLTWQCLIVVIVMALQMAMMDIEFSRRDWLVSGLFICGCFVSALPWLPSKTVNAIAPWYLAFGGIVAAVVYLGMEGLNQTYQDKLFRKLDTAITEQVFFISLFAAVIRIIGFLWEFRCLESISFHAKHPFSFASVLLLSFMGVVMTFLMSYMLRLCGALICVMIHQIMVNILAGKSQELNFVNNVFKWVGIIFMLGMLGTTMSMMQHNHQKCDRIQLTDEEMDEFEVEDESLLPGVQSVNKSNQQAEIP